VNAISFRSLESVTFAASPMPPETLAGFADAGETVHSAPLRENRISSCDTQLNDAMSDVRMSGSTVARRQRSGGGVDGRVRRERFHTEMR
jgi:hypothetical protein